LDYFNRIAEKQPYRSTFVAILSDLKRSYVLISDYSPTVIKVSIKIALTLADAIIYVDTLSQSQCRVVPPTLDKQFLPYSILAPARNHFLLSVRFPDSVPNTPLAAPNVTPQMRTVVGENTAWLPLRHRSSNSRLFVIKVVHSETSLENEIRILKQIKTADDMSHFPEIVWSLPGDKQFGILPVGKSIDQKKGVRRKVSRNIVTGLTDGLKYLHGQKIIHRDIRLLNLILDSNENVVITDYETSYWDPEATQVTYEGGYLCWPR
jgi:hypothetical protein